jgi:uncharacterized phosphatase
MKHLYFCRHGESEFNLAGRWAGSTETPLTQTGREQAHLAGKSAQGLGINHIICSPLSRAHDTAQIIAEEIKYPAEAIEINSLVIERHFGSLEGQMWDPDLNIDGISDAETKDSILERARMLLKYLKTLEAETVLIVSHGSFGRALRHVLEPHVAFHETERFQNAKVVKLI